MILAHMISVDNNALICDLAETYHIYDYESLPCNLIATLSCGLGNDSRIKRKIVGMPITMEVMLLARILDDLNLIAWMNSKDGASNRNRPKSVTEALLNPGKQKDEILAFNDGDDFMAYRKQLLRKARGGT